MSMKSGFATGFSFIILIIFLSGCGAPKSKERANNQESIPVKVTKIKLEEMRQSIDYVGDIRAQDEATIYPKVSGKIIEKLKEDGAAVDKNEIIAYIDRDEVGLKFEKAPVESPLAGIIGRVYVDIGTNVNTQTPIALVVDIDKVEIDLDVPEKYLSLICIGQEARIKVDAFPQQVFSGKVKKISPVIDLATRSSPVEIVADNNDHKLKSGMFTKVSLVIRRHSDVPVVLKEAVLGKEPNVYVFVVEDNKAVLRNVTVGIRQGPYYEIKEGIKEGDRVVIMGQQRLYEGAAVFVEEENGVNTEKK